jgi:hypothetical protein
MTVTLSERSAAKVVEDGPASQLASDREAAESGRN